ncbi:MAG: hypothetical protein WDO71_24345 [Bacteroidota bacterium]
MGHFKKQVKLLLHYPGNFNKKGMGRSSYQQSLRKAVYFPLINVNLYFDIATVFYPVGQDVFIPGK